ncbi:MAG TPA: hypothetical protein DCQ64_05060 [Candidatus Rokubacteria bacterium]|nr:hypothetical protein [Candidatus Rokubacteria bacterium]
MLARLDDEPVLAPEDEDSRLEHWIGEGLRLLRAIREAVASHRRCVARLAAAEERRAKAHDAWQVAVAARAEAESELRDAADALRLLRALFAPVAERLRGWDNRLRRRFRRGDSLRLLSGPEKSLAKLWHGIDWRENELPLPPGS